VPERPGKQLSGEGGRGAREKGSGLATITTGFLRSHCVACARAGDVAEVVKACRTCLKSADGLNESLMQTGKKERGK